MKKSTSSKSAFLNLRILLSLSLWATGAALGFVAFRATEPVAQAGPRLANLRVDLNRRPDRTAALQSSWPSPAALTVPTALTFGHPVISGIAGVGFEQDLRLDPSDPNRIYTSAPGTAAANTSWIWHSLDAGKTFKWVVGAAPLQGKVTNCNGGGDTELAVDLNGRLYFNDLTLANFSVARSDDGGATFTCSNTGVPDTAVDRQWYSIDGDPLTGGSIYLANDEIGPGGVMCGSSVGNNVLVMYRSPATGAGTSAGLVFGPANHVSAVGSCDEAIMGNNELSPVATTLGQPNGLGGYATLATPVKHVFVIHDNAALNKIFIGRCFPVAFGLPVPNVSDPSGLNCTDLVAADLGVNAKTGGDFPTLAIDKAGNLYAVWEEAPIDANGVVIGDTVLKYAYSTTQGNTWSAPIQIDTSGSADGVLHNNVFAWVAAGDDGRVNIAWYGTPGLHNPNDQTCGVNAPLPPAQGKNINGPDSTTGALWSLWLVQTLNGHSPSPTFSAPVRASEHHTHRGTIQTLLGGQCGDRTQGDFLQLRTGAQGEAQIGYSDSNNIVATLAPHGMFVRQNSGAGLYSASSPVNISGLAPFNGVSDPSGDGKYEVAGTSSANMPQLDILSSSVTKVTSAPCSALQPCYKVVMQISNLSLAPTIAQDPNPDLVWLTQWMVPSTTDATGGKNFHVYAESNNGAALQCFVGENAAATTGGGVSISYPGNTTLPAANCQSNFGPNGNITIYVPLSGVSEPGAVDNRLHEVAASTMTLQQPANTVPAVGGIGGSFFNLIDVAQAYVFDPAQLQILSITRLPNGHILLNCLGSPNALNTVQASPDLVIPFAPIASVPANAAGVFQYDDPGAVGLDKRFYRISLP